MEKEQNEVKKENKETNTIVVEGDIMIVIDDGCVSFATQDSNWVIDYGASFYVNIRMGNNGVSKIVGIGDICFETNIGNKLVLKDVRHVPDIRLNLISTGKLDDEEFSNSLGESKWKLTKGSLVMARRKKYNTLYVMEVKLHKGEINAGQ